MTSEQTCPNNDHLKALLDDTLPAEEQSTLEKHLETCSECRLRFERLASGGTLSNGDANVAEALDTPDTALEELKAKLKTEPQSETTIGESPGDAAVSLDFLAPSENPQSLGRLGIYDIRGVIGSGGMGVVLKGHDPRLDRIVAIKVLSPQLASNATARKRFLREAQKAAAVAHEHVVAIHAVDEQDHLPYIVMEYIVGVSLDERIKRSGSLKTEEILRIGMQTASGLAAAHAQGLVHRDVKPSNILLENGVERVKLADFGLARAIDDTEITGAGVVVGTPQYMSPEQARGEPVDHRSDLFGLGCVMYAMCTGRSPFRAATVVDAIRRVCDDTPRPIQSVNPEVPDWLIEIIDHLLAKQPENRFQTATEVTELLGGHLAHLQRPGEAPMPSTQHAAMPSTGQPAARGRRWIACSLAAVVLLLCGIVFMSEFTGITDIFPGIAARHKDRNRSGREPDGVGGPDPNKASLIVEVTPGGRPDRPIWTATRVSGEGFDETWTEPGKYERLLEPGSYSIEVCDKETGNVVRSGELVLRPRMSRFISIFNNRQFRTSLPRQDSPMAELLGHSGEIRHPVFSPDGRLLATAGLDEKVVLWRVVDSAMTEVRELKGRCCVFSPDGSTIVTGCRDGKVRLCDVATGQIQAILEGHNTAVDYLCVAKSGLLASRSVGGVVIIWDTAGQEQIRRFNAFPSKVSAIALSPDGTTLATGHKDTDVILWDAHRGQRIRTLKGHAPGIQCLVFSPDGALLATGGNDTSVRLWEVESGQCLMGFGQTRETVNSLAFSPDGQRLAAGCEDQSVKLWSVPDRELLNSFHADWGIVSALAFSPNEETLVTGSGCHTIRLWNVDELPGSVPKSSPLRKLPSLYVRAHAHHIIFSTDVSPDAKQLAVEFSAGYVLCCDLATFQAESFFAARDEKAEPFVKYLHDNKTLATSAGGSLRLFDLGTLTERRDTNILHGRRWAPFDVSHNDRVIAIVSGKDALTLWNLESREPIDKLRSSHGDIRSFRFAPKNEVLAIGTSQGAILLCDTNAPDDDFRVLTHGSSPVESVAFSPDGKQLASADPSGATRIWDVAEGSEVAKLDQGAVTVAFSHDGKMLATGYDKDKPNVGHVTLWSTETWEPLTTWQEPGYMQKTLFASDGKLVVLTDASYVSVWDVPTFLENLPSPQ